VPQSGAQAAGGDPVRKCGAQSQIQCTRGDPKFGYGGFLGAYAGAPQGLSYAPQFTQQPLAMQPPGWGYIPLGFVAAPTMQPPITNP